MFRSLQMRLTLAFTGIVFFFQFFSGYVFIYFRYLDGEISTGTMVVYATWLLVEVLLISLITFVVGYFFVQQTLQPAVDMFRRVEQFSQDASHELKTPLGIANSALDLAVRTKQYGKYIGQAKSQLKVANNLIEKLLELAVLDQAMLSHKDVLVDDMIVQVVDDHHLLIKEKKIKVLVSAKLGIHWVADPALLYRILSALLDNAIKFNHPQGRIEIAVTKRRISISNTGEMIPAKELGNIFDRFYQTESSRTSKGYGIGLAIVRRICELHGWQIQVQSTKELTTFSIVVPSGIIPS